MFFFWLLVIGNSGDAGVARAEGGERDADGRVVGFVVGTELGARGADGHHGRLLGRVEEAGRLHDPRPQGDAHAVAHRQLAVRRPSAQGPLRARIPSARLPVRRHSALFSPLQR